MTKLSDTQSILLAAAAQRERGSLLPAPETVSATSADLPKAITALVKRGLAEQRQIADAATALRGDGDLHYGVFVTAAGLAAIGVADARNGEPSTPVAAEPASPAPPRATKAATVVNLLQHPDGTTLAELIAATGWLPHTTRAALTGLRKKGHTIERGKRGDETFYRIVEPA